MIIKGTTPSPSLNDLSPEAARYIRDLPHAALTSLRNQAYGRLYEEWSALKEAQYVFFLTMMHTSRYSRCYRDSMQSRTLDVVLRLELQIRELQDRTDGAHIPTTSSAPSREK